MSDTMSQGDLTRNSEGEELYGVLAEFDDPHDLIEGAKVVRDAGYQHFDCYSPFPVHGIDPAMGVKRTRLPLVVFAGGAGGLALGTFLQWWTNAYDWPWIVSGKPFWSIPANIPVMFETTVLAAAFTTFLGMWAMNRLPTYWHPFFRSRRFRTMTDNGFFLGIQASDAEFDPKETVTLLRRAGASDVERIHLDPNPARQRIPRPLVLFVVLATVLALVPFALIARARAKRSDKPHIHVIPDMDFQHKTKSQSLSVNFDDFTVWPWDAPDGEIRERDVRGSRLPVDGTVARGNLREDDHFYRGSLGEGADGKPEWATTFPPQFEISEAAVDRGQQRFTIYCAPCHGVSGRGDGMIDKRAKTVNGNWSPPTSLHMDHIVAQPHGQLFHTISQGIRTMRGYAAQIPESDRWAIILYVRALQRSQLTTVGDVPEGKLETAAPPAADEPADAKPAGEPPPAAPATDETKPEPSPAPAASDAAAADKP